MLILYLLLFSVLCFVLIKSGEALVKLLAQLSRFLKLTEFVLAFILMTFATTLPELIVGTAAGFRNMSVVSLGNIIGSNLINLSFILGLVVVLSKGLKVESKIIKKDAWIIFFIALLPLIFLLNKTLSRLEGFVLLIVFGWYVWRLLKKKDSFKHRVHHITHNINSLEKFSRVISYFLIAAAILILSAWGLIEISKLIAVELYIPIALVSIILVALGTSLPELVFGVKAAILKHEGMSLGNLVGSIVVNSTLVLGITAIINPIRLENIGVVLIGAIFMFVAVALANIFLTSGRKISIKEGWILIGFYILFLIAEFIFR